MASYSLPSQAVLNQLLRYEPDTGKLFWRERSPVLFEGRVPNPRVSANKWNGRFAGTEAFTTALRLGHRYASIWSRKVYAHRVIWKMVHGVEPDVIDHINGDPSDNRLSNLRSVSQKDNSRNAKLGKNSSSGVNGVSAHRCGWASSICVDRKTIHLGIFRTLEEARAARLAADQLYRFHPNHGRSA